jgi:hypothetical protein
MILGRFSTVSVAPVDNFVEKSHRVPAKAHESRLSSTLHRSLRKIQSLMNQWVANTPQLS